MAAPGDAGRTPARHRRATASPGTPNGTWRPLAVTPSPRAAMRTISSFISAGERLRDCLGEIVGDHLAARQSPPRARAARPPAQAASNAGKPRARIAAIIPASTSPVPALASHAGAARRKAEPPVRRSDQRVRALVDDHRARPPRRLERPLRLRARDSPNSLRNSPSCGVMIASWPLSRSGSPRWVIASASITLGAFEVSASVSTCGMSPRPGPTSRQPIRSSLTWRAVDLDDRRRAGRRSAATC